MRQLQYSNPLGVSVVLYQSPNFITSLDGIDLPTVDEQSQKAPYQDGETDLDARFEARTVVVQGSMLYPNNIPAIWANRKAMLAALNPTLGLGKLTLSTDNEVVWTFARCMVAQFPSKDGTQSFQDFHIEFYCPDPFWYAQAQSSISLQTVRGGKKFPFTFPTTFGVYQGIVPIPGVNTGDSETPVVITFAGPAVNPVITNVTRGQKVKCLLSLNIGDVLVVNTKFGSKSVILIRNGVPSNQMGTLDPDSVFWSLAVGVNQISFSDDLQTSNKTCVVAWNARFVGK